MGKLYRITARNLKKSLAIATVCPLRIHNNLTHARKLILDSVPDYLVVNSVISVSQEVPHPAEAFPIGPGSDPSGILAKTNCCLSHNLHSRWMLGLPPILFGLFHLIGIRVFATIVPQWMGFGYFWAGLTGVAFLLAGLAICSGIRDVLALRLLALMLLLFDGLVEMPPIFIRLHDQPTWGAAVYSLPARGLAGYSQSSS